MDKREKWNAVISCDQNYDGIFFYGVKSTGIYCRPSCRSKNPNLKNILYFESKEEAEMAGFRPCKRCRPDLISYNPSWEAAGKTKHLIDRFFADRLILQQELDSIGISRNHLTKLFEKQYDMTIKQYINQVRFLQAQKLLAQGKTITDVAFTVGMESSASFTTFFKKQAGIPPSQYVLKQIAESPCCFCKTPLGTIRITENQNGITGICFADNKSVSEYSNAKGIYLADAQRQIMEYFSKQRTTFDVPLAPKGSNFQLSVWSELQKIPYGKTKSYQEIAYRMGNSKAARAVGMANNRNPILIMIPCHRVVGKNNKLVGYAGGIERKEYILRLEAENG